MSQARRKTRLNPLPSLHRLTAEDQGPHPDDAQPGEADHPLMNITARTLVSSALVSLALTTPARADLSFTSTATNVPTDSSFPSEIVAADFNNDGVTDLATANCGDLCGSTVPAGGAGSVS